MTLITWGIEDIYSPIGILIPLEFTPLKIYTVEDLNPQSG
jgi:hypothetical protein